MLRETEVAWSQGKEQQGMLADTPDPGKGMSVLC